MSPSEERPTAPVRFGFVSTYPPTLCGLATFTSALSAELAPAGMEGKVVRVVESGQQCPGTEVIAQLIANDPASAHRAARALDSCDVAIIQHEYGIYGGPDGAEIMPFMAALRIPTVVVLHTVLSAPTGHQREVLEQVASAADALVVMTMTAYQRLAAGYLVDMAKVSVIPHGVSITRPNHAPPFRSAQPTVLTWGLLGPGKGIEWGIAAMALLRGLRPVPRYVVAGQTHPKVLQHEGEAYRLRLQQRVRELDLAAMVSFDGHYRTAGELAELVSSADVVLLPYDTTEQVTSGVLIEAVAAGKPVIATRFPHAEELISGGAGILVGHHDPAAIADALRQLLGGQGTDRPRAATMNADELRWPAVADRYRRLAVDLMSARVAA
jgi:glycosyltransferase involved in cell wall biosynthesis